MDLLRISTQFKSSMGVIDSVIAKYFATVVGYYIVSRPFMDLAHPRHLNRSTACFYVIVCNSTNDLSHFVARTASSCKTTTLRAACSSRWPRQVIAIHYND